jgi:hypothetical protein
MLEYMRGVTIISIDLFYDYAETIGREYQLTPSNMNEYDKLNCYG